MSFYTDTCADLSFNLLSRPEELFLITCLQRLDNLDVGCNEMCIHPEYHASVKAMRHRIGTLKKLNDEAVVNAFVGYGEDAAMQQHAGEARLAGLDRDLSRSFFLPRSLLNVSGFETCRRGAYREREREKERERVRCRRCPCILYSSRKIQVCCARACALSLVCVSGLENAAEGVHVQLVCFGVKICLELMVSF